MKKGLAIAIATGALLGVFASQNPTDAVPMPGQVVSPQQQQVQVVAQQQNPQNGWDVPDLGDKDDSKFSVKPVVGDDGKPVIQVALLLDTSGSMSSLIDQAKTELWSIVNKLGEAKYKGQSPRIEVALYEYGKSSLARDEGYIRQLAPFTHDLDGLSEILFALQTNGGDEYCAWVIRSAMDSLKWKQRKGSLRMIFVAGNEPFTQGPVEVNPVMEEANQKGIMVHPIYCSNGNRSDQISWESAADLAHTDLKVIDHTRVAKIPATPYDKRINELNSQLNRTYVGYGVEGRAKVARQQAQDANMASVGSGAAAERAVTKSSAAYSNSEWDLVDKAEAEGGVLNIDEDALPAEVRDMSPKDREAYVAKKADERKKIQEEIQTLNKQRQEFIAEKQAESASGDVTLGKAVIKTVKVQAAEQGFTME
ncbi:MAG: VWA domain-containing protein [Candidatus Eremiobacteraeota bacterium]|nr:VWA domain-containing protein [Candidatus Eremiobacteraeota bacterium]